MIFEKFKELSESYNVVPVYEKITADMLTPVLAYLKLRDKNQFCFLLESVEGIGRIARYSFIGKNPRKLISTNGEIISIQSSENVDEITGNLFDYLKEEISNYSHPRIEELPDFTGGLVGYIGFENISLIENSIDFDGEDELKLPDSIMGVFENIVAFDHYKHQIILIANVAAKNFASKEEAYNHGKNNINELKSELKSEPNYKSKFHLSENTFEDFSENDFFEQVKKAKENIYNGDVFQLVLSKRFRSKFQGDVLNVYRALRIINPSPYMYFMEFGDEFSVIGTSPEDLIKVQNRKATILPIAGTRRRGKTIREDEELERDLLSDPKEIAEHVMLVDLARNDLGRVCNYNSISLTEQMKVHKYSHVMHIVSRVEGELKESADCIDALRASFPAGTVSGAPKIRAIQLINEYEKLRRNVYAGAVGYIDFNGNMDMCIAIRTLFAVNNTIYWQAGAGIVADSKPELELKEIRNKSAVLESALKYAEVIDEDISNR